MWQMDEAFHLKGHVFHSTLSGKGDYEALRKKISELMSNPLDYSRPLWDVHIIDNYNGGSAVVWRIHHAIADGIALIKVVFSLTGTSAKESLNHSLGAYAPKVPKKHGVLDDIGQLFHTGENLFHEAQHLLQHPETLKDALDHTWKAAKEIGALFGSKEITGSLYKGTLSLKKKQLGQRLSIWM
jgi:diacylglycerol O-acyltransferase